MYDQIMQYLPEVGKVVLSLIALCFAFGAKVMDPLRSSEARGKVGGTVYNTSKSVKYVKSFTSPGQPRTQKQLTVRANMQVATRAWAILDDATRQLWKDYADVHPEIDWTGTSIKKSGFNWFTRCYMRVLQFFAGSISNPPGTAAPDAVSEFASGPVVGGLHTTWTPSGTATDYLQFYLVGPHSAGVSAKFEMSRFKNQEPALSGGYNISGLVPGTYTIFARVLNSETGLVSVMVSDVGVVT